MADKVFASTMLNSASPLALPVVDDANAYLTAKPGPKNPCSVTSGTAPTWDNDTTLDLTNYPNGSVPTAFNLTPGSNYTCEATDGSGSIVGQLDWNNTTKTLTIKGKMYIDGSVYSNNGAVNLYSGSATLYLSGTFSITNSTKFCGSTAGAACDFTAWTPNSNILVVVAHGDNGTGYSISMANTTKWQGGFFAAKGIDLGQSSTDEGPMFAIEHQPVEQRDGQAAAGDHESPARSAHLPERPRRARPSQLFRLNGPGVRNLARSGKAGRYPSPLRVRRAGGRPPLSPSAHFVALVLFNLGVCFDWVCGGH